MIPRDVQHQQVPPGKTAPAMRAGVGLLSSVGLHVPLQVLGQCRLVRTVLAGVGLLPGMGAHVFLQHVAEGCTIWTKLTLEDILPRLADVGLHLKERVVKVLWCWWAMMQRLRVYVMRSKSWGARWGQQVRDCIQRKIGVHLLMIKLNTIKKYETTYYSFNRWLLRIVMIRHKHNTNTTHAFAHRHTIRTFEVVRTILSCNPNRIMKWPPTHARWCLARRWAFLSFHDSSPYKT